MAKKQRTAALMGKAAQGTTTPPASPPAPPAPADTADTGAPTVITSFRGPYRFLSNYADYPVTLNDGTTFKNAEAAFQSRRTLNPYQAKQFTKLLPGDAKRLGQRVTPRKDWEEVKVREMEAVVEAKFKNPYLRDLLLNTGDAELVDNNTWNDKFWGVCDGVGENRLGKILMALRQRLREASSGNDTAEETDATKADGAPEAEDEKTASEGEAETTDRETAD